MSEVMHTKHSGTPCRSARAESKAACLTTGSGGGESDLSERTASRKAVPEFHTAAMGDYRARVQRVFETHGKPIMPSGKLLRDCFLNELPPKAVYQVVMDILGATA